MNISLCCCKDFVRLKLVYGLHYRYGRSAWEDFADVLTPGCLAYTKANENVALRISSVFTYDASFDGIPAIGQAAFTHNYTGSLIDTFSRLTGIKTSAKIVSTPLFSLSVNRPTTWVDEGGTGFEVTNTTRSCTGTEFEITEVITQTLRHQTYTGSLATSTLRAVHTYSEDHSTGDVESEVDALLALVEFDDLAEPAESDLPEGFSVDDRATMWMIERFNYYKDGVAYVDATPLLFPNPYFGATGIITPTASPWTMIDADSGLWIDGRWVVYDPIGGPSSEQLLPIVTGKCWNGLNANPADYSSSLPGASAPLTYYFRWCIGAKGQLVTGRRNLWIRTTRSKPGEVLEQPILSEQIIAARPTEFILDPDRTGTGPWFGQLMLYDPLLVV